MSRFGVPCRVRSGGVQSRTTLRAGVKVCTWPHAGGSMTPLERNLSQSRLGLQVVLELVIIMTHLSCFSI